MGAARSGDSNKDSERRVFQPRVKGEPGKFNCFVRFSHLGKDRVSPGIFADVSANGMHIVSRGPSRVRVGDLLTIEFGLPGDEKMFTKRARVVRRINEFVFAVHFLAPGEELRPAMDRFATYARWSTWFGLGQRISRWAQAHKQGALLCFVGLVVALIVGTWIYLGSDQYLGRQPRSWGREIPRQWYWDYYNKIPGAQTSPQDAPQTPPKTSP